jgi:Na+-driven multidrug efflux pump
MLARSLMGAVMMWLVASCGTVAVAAYGIGLRFHMIILMPGFALGGGAATLVGQNLGAGKPGRAARAAWLATGINAAFMALAAVLMMILAPELIRAFNSEVEVIQVGARYLRIISPFYVFTAAGIVLGRSLNGAGDSLTPMIITVLTLGLQVPLAVLFSHLWHPATQGIWWAIVVATVLNGILVAAWFQTGRWKRTRV